MDRKEKIGIMSREQFKRYTLEIARGERKPQKGEPKVWCDSLESLAQVLRSHEKETVD